LNVVGCSIWVPSLDPLGAVFNSVELFEEIQKLLGKRLLLHRMIERAQFHRDLRIRPIHLRGRLSRVSFLFQAIHSRPLSLFLAPVRRIWLGNARHRKKFHGSEPNFRERVNAVNCDCRNSKNRG
jgi:hypothetical protein